VERESASRYEAVMPLAETVLPFSEHKYAPVFQPAFEVRLSTLNNRRRPLCPWCLYGYAALLRTPTLSVYRSR